MKYTDRWVDRYPSPKRTHNMNKGITNQKHLEVVVRRSYSK